MAKKSKKIEKQTRQLMESMNDLVKKKGDKYKFKTGSKKKIRKMKKTCVHWIMRKGKDTPTVIQDPENAKNWKCTICGASFPIRPMEVKDYLKIMEEYEGVINQLQFWSVKMGGDAEDTKLFLKLRSEVPRSQKIMKNIVKQVNKRQKWEDRKANTDTLAAFDSYAGFNYRS